jgi:lycopene cyclase domain-containing protein
MQFEYLLFNIIVIAGPLAYSFEKNVYFRQYWREAALGIGSSLVVYVVWDAAVTNRHWFFNPLYIMDFRFFKLPIEEWLFFITVPYACLFVKEVLAIFVKNRSVRGLEWVRAFMFAFLPAGIIVFQNGKEYTGLVLIAFSVVAFVDRQLGVHTLLQTRTYLLLACVVGFTFVFNMYLTARPLLIYAPEYQLDFRIITIPIEDFGYGVTHIALCNIVYEYFKVRAGKSRA